MDEKEEIKTIPDHNSRCDGVFRYGVRSMGIVCKSSCSTKAPLLKNIKLSDRLENVLKSGYRSCKICMKVTREKNTIKIRRYESPCDVLMLGLFDGKLRLHDWQVEKHRDHVDKCLKRILRVESEEGALGVIEKAVEQLNGFLAGKRSDFDVPLLFVGADLQKAVWDGPLKIPFG